VNLQRKHGTDSQMMMIILIVITIVIIIKQRVALEREGRGKMLCHMYGRMYFTHTKPFWSMHTYCGEYK